MSAPPSARTARSAGSDAPAAPSGRLLLRMPSELHGELARAAEREGTSLNQFITRTLAGAVGLDGAARADPTTPPARGRDVTTIVLVANAVAVGLAALAAVAILLVAWQG
jgi:hypothetical protein